MKRFLFGLLACLLLAPASLAWNDKGHMVVAKLAWKELTAEERGKILKVLESHPHYAEFLKGDRPEGIPEDEWIFMRAATWADWVRGGPPERKAYNKPDWHYINIPFVPKGDDTKAPGAADSNIVVQIDKSKKLTTAGGDRVERALHVTWLFHLVGDLHQPLHASSQWSHQFPEGDRGGNRIRIRSENGVIQLHSFWDGLLGKEVSNSSIGEAVLDVEKASADDAAVKDDLDKHKTPMEWAEESHAKAVESAYLNGGLVVASEDQKLADADLPEAPKDYMKQAGATARLQVAKAGKRLAAILREVAAAN